MVHEAYSYSTGQAATELDTTPAHIRALCQAGLIPGAFRTGGNQWRVPRSSLAKIREKGLPALPHAILSQPINGYGDEDNEPPEVTRPEDSPGVHAAIKDALIQRQKRESTEHRLGTLKLERELDEAAEYFRQKDAAEIERENKRKEELARAKAVREREEWLRHWEAYASNRLRWVSYDADSQTRLDLHEAVRERLEKLRPIPDDYVTKRLIDAEIEKAATAWKRKKDTQEAIEYAAGHLPWDVKHDGSYAKYKDRAINAATEAVNRIPNADRRDKQNAAVQAMQGVVAQYQRVQECKAVVGDLSRHLPGATKEEVSTAIDNVAQALLQLPIGTSRAQMEALRDRICTPLRETGASREQARKTAEEAERTKRTAELRLMFCPSKVHGRLGDLERNKKVEFNSFNERWTIGGKLAERIRPLLIRELVQSPQMPEDALGRRIDALVDEHLDEFLDEE